MTQSSRKILYNTYIVSLSYRCTFLFDRKKTKKKRMNWIYTDKIGVDDLSACGVKFAAVRLVVVLSRAQSVHPSNVKCSGLHVYLW